MTITGAAATGADAIGADAIGAGVMLPFAALCAARDLVALSRVVAATLSVFGRLAVSAIRCTDESSADVLGAVASRCRPRAGPPRADR